jgi:hypothetical protein
MRIDTSFKKGPQHEETARSPTMGFRSGYNRAAKLEREIEVLDGTAGFTIIGKRRAPGALRQRSTP